jgi:MscS family membrane protein
MPSLYSIVFAFLQDAAEATQSQPSGDAPKETPEKPVDPAAELSKFLTDHVGNTISKTTWEGWVILFAGIFGGLIAGWIASSVLKRVGDKLKSRGWIARGSVFRYAAGPANLAVFSFFLGLGFSRVAMDEPVALLVTKAVALLYVVAIGWFLYNLVDLVEFGIRRVTTDSTIIQLLRKALRIFLLIIFVLFVAENFFEAEITAWLAGLGLAGLAVSLAAQGPIKNLFGSVSVVMDRPFGLGDTITFGGYTGVVEIMGFRSTKLRTASGHLVTIPNSKLIEDIVENITARQNIRRELNVTIACDTPPEKVEQALRIIRDLLAEPSMTATFNMEEAPPRVTFNNFNADSLNINVMYWYQLSAEGRDVWSYSEQTEQFNLRLLRALNEAGINMAFPTRTVYLAGDAGRELAIRLVANGDGVLNPKRQPELS